MAQVPTIKRCFNTEGICRPAKHYMVRLDERLALIKEHYVDCGSYFVINRGRQYGKTTTLYALADYLKEEYVVLSLDFQELSMDDYQGDEVFSRAFAKILLWMTKNQSYYEELFQPLQAFVEDIGNTMNDLFRFLSGICQKSPKPIVLIIDEVDSASNNQVFLDFLANLRRYYLNRENVATFHSVILAGVYDIKNLKLKLRSEEESQYNSPWNIAAKFDVPMDFSVGQIAGMLREYEDDRHTGMDIAAIAEEIYAYTSGYPYLVSAICKRMDEELFVWSREGVEKAVKILISESVPLFESMVRQMDQYKELREMMENIIYRGAEILYNSYVKPIRLGEMFGYLKNKNGKLVVANRIFEMVLLDLFIAEEHIKSDAFQYGSREKPSFIREGRLDMDKVMEKFVEYYTDICGSNSDKFLEDNGRKMFLLFLKPIINGTGNYYIEAQTRDTRRTDVIVDYCGEQFIIEMKIWRGNEYHERGEQQLADYLDYYHKDKGYMLSFNFNKNKDVGVRQIQIGGKTVVEAVV